MIVVSDTSPLTSLLQINRESILVDLYDRVVIPQAVERELRLGHSMLPSFLKVVAAQDRDTVSRLRLELDPGEAEAIAVAQQLRADLLLIDERRGRAVASREGLPVVGLLGVLIVAKKKGLIRSLAELLSQLETTADFRLASPLKARALREVGENG
jgi:predicted nucleic acid-binding protein